MRPLKFTKMVGAGNDFVVIDNRQCSRLKTLDELARRLCERKGGVGADGMLVLGKSKMADFKMQIFNADGSEAEMCGNGLRCATLLIGKNKKMKAETKAGIYETEIIAKDRVKVKIGEPKDLSMDFPIDLNGRTIRVNYINTGVPHVVVFVDGLEDIDVKTIGSNIRYHEEFKPKGANVDFVQIIDDRNIRMRTYERGVEGETLACGTGAVASAIITCQVSCLDFARDRRVMPRLRSGQACHGMKVHTPGGILRVGFSKIGNKIKDVYLEGEAKVVFKGNIIL